MFGLGITAVAAGLEILQDLPTLPLRADVIGYNSNISACGHCIQWQQGLQLLRSAVSVALEPSVITVNASTTACEKASQWCEAIQLLSFASDAVTYAACLACAIAWPRAMQLLGEAQRRRLGSLVSCNAAVSACVEGSQWQMALQLLAEADSVDIITYNAAISACSWHLAVALLRSSQCDTSFRPNVLTYGAALLACERHPLALMTLRQLLGEVEELGHQLTAVR
eukprot:s1625_g8.t1